MEEGGNTREILWLSQMKSWRQSIGQNCVEESKPKQGSQKIGENREAQAERDVRLSDEKRRWIFFDHLKRLRKGK